MDLDADPLDASDVWFIIKGSYEGVEFGFPPNPIDYPPTVAYNFNEYSEPYFTDCTTPTPKRVVNTASDPFEQFLERDNADLTIAIETNEEGFPVLTIDALKYTVNAEAVYIDGVTYAAGTLRLNPPTAQRVKEKVEGEGGTFVMRTYYKVSWVVKAKHEGWNDKVLDVGFNELVKDTSDPQKPGRIMPICNAANAKIDKPWPLSQGRKKPKPDEKPDELEFVPYKQAIWPWRWTKAAAWADA